MYTMKDRVVMFDAINGVEYYTQEAEVIASYDNGLDEDNPCYFKETLFRKSDTGEYFMRGFGGVQSVYGGDIRIVPMVRDDVKAWMLNYFDNEFCRDVFGEEAIW